MSYKICCDIPKTTPIATPFHLLLRLYQTHYQVLNLPATCSTQEIKNAFIKLSKEHHPDVNKSEQSHAEFLKISEAYKVLGKAQTRRDYDLGLASPRKTGVYYAEEIPVNGRNPYRDPSFWANRDKSQDTIYKNHPYYGIKGIQRVSNGTVVILCLLCALAGVGLQFLAINKSLTFNRDEIIKKAMEAERVLNETKATASSNGNQLQLEILKIKLAHLTKKDSDNK